MCARAMMCVREYYAFIIIVIDGKVDANQKKNHFEMNRLSQKYANETYIRIASN